MRVRQLAGQAKVLVSDTGKWATSDLPPRHAPHYLKSRPIRNGWKWRAARARVGSTDYVLTGLCNPSRDNWQAVLTVELPGGASVIARFEAHGSHPGLHVHGHCVRGGIELGAKGLNDLARIPDVSKPHRRTNAWTEITFWDAAKRFFRIAHAPLPLFDA